MPDSPRSPFRHGFPAYVCAGKERQAPTIEAIREQAATHSYVADRELATAVFLILTLGRPLLLVGEAGVGKTEVARVLANALDAELIRLQCYEGIDVNT